MAKMDPAPLDEFLWSIAAARMVLPDDVHLQAPPNLIDDVSMLIDAGIDDLGGISPVTLDHVNPERAWPEITRLAKPCRRSIRRWCPGSRSTLALPISPRCGSMKPIGQLYSHSTMLKALAGEMHGYRVAKHCHLS